MKRTIAMIAIAVILLACSIFIGCTASCERECKDCQSDISGGLERIVIVYNMNGEEMARYKGKIDLAITDGCVQFEYNGKRVIWYNAIIQILEK